MKKNTERDNSTAVVFLCIAIVLIFALVCSALIMYFATDGQMTLGLEGITYNLVDPVSEEGGDDFIIKITLPKYANIIVFTLAGLAGLSLIFSLITPIINSLRQPKPKSKD